MKKMFFVVMILVLGLVVAQPDVGFSDEPDEGSAIMLAHGVRSGAHAGVAGGWWRPHGYWQGEVEEFTPMEPAMRSLTPEQREEFDKLWGKYLQDTLKVRQELISKQMELEALWAQENVDEKKVKKISSEVAELRADISKTRNEYLIKCRQQFGTAEGWSCPGGW